MTTRSKSDFITSRNSCLLPSTQEMLQTTTIILYTNLTALSLTVRRHILVIRQINCRIGHVNTVSSLARFLPILTQRMVCQLYQILTALSLTVRRHILVIRQINCRIGHVNTVSSLARFLPILTQRMVCQLYQIYPNIL